MSLDEKLNIFGIRFENSWSEGDKKTVLRAAYRTGLKIASIAGGTAWGAFKNAFGATIVFSKDSSIDYCTGGNGVVACGSGMALDEQLIVHEFGHSFSQHNDRGPYTDLGNAQITDAQGEWVTGTHPGGEFERTRNGYRGDGPPYMYHGPRYWSDWNSNVDNVARNEDYADMFMNWVFNSFVNSGAGTRRNDWMNANVAAYVGGR